MCASDRYLAHKEKHLDRALVARHGSLDRHAEPTGVPQHMGVYYALSASLVVQGLLSACYHVCPGFSNFQIGTLSAIAFILLLLLACWPTKSL